MKFEIKNRKIKGDKDLFIVGNNSNYVAEFVFDEEWNGVTKTARFITANKEYTDQILEHNKCKIPCEVLQCGFVSVGVYSAEMSTTDLSFYVHRSIKSETGCVCEPTPDVYEQLLKKLDDLIITGGGIAEESDPTVPECVKNITEQDIEKWNNNGNNEVLQQQIETLNKEFDNYYTKGETESFVQNQNFATKGYVDDLIGNINTALENVLGV